MLRGLSGLRELVRVALVLGYVCRRGVHHYVVTGVLVGRVCHVIVPGRVVMRGVVVVR